MRQELEISATEERLLTTAYALMTTRLAAAQRDADRAEAAIRTARAEFAAEMRWLLRENDVDLPDGVHVAYEGERRLVWEEPDHDAV